MSCTFALSTDPNRDLIRVSVAGFFAVGDVADLGQALHRVHAELRSAPNCHVTLCDAARMHIQTQEGVAAFSDLVRQPFLRSRRLAFVVGTSLARSQTRRLGEPDRDTIAYFDTVAAAEAWLFDQPAIEAPSTAVAPRRPSGPVTPAITSARTASRYRHAPASPTSGGHGYTGPSAG